MAKSRHLKAQNKNITVHASEYETDAPPISPEVVERLNKINPNHVT